MWLSFDFGSPPFQALHKPNLIQKELPERSAKIWVCQASTVAKKTSEPVSNDPFDIEKH